MACCYCVVRVDSCHSPCSLGASRAGLDFGAAILLSPSMRLWSVCAAAAGASLNMCQCCETEFAEGVRGVAALGGGVEGPCSAGDAVSASGVGRQRTILDFCLAPGRPQCGHLRLADIRATAPGPPL